MQHHVTVEIEPERTPGRFTRWVRHGCPVIHKMLNSNPQSSSLRSKSPPHPGNSGPVHWLEQSLYGLVKRLIQESQGTYRPATQQIV
jgi:hypothetical protein